MPERVIAVRGPRGDEAALAEAAGKTLAPEQSLQRVETTAKVVFTNVAVIATALAGLGLATDAGAALDRGPQILGIPVLLALVAGSLVSATVALTPSLRTVRRNSLTSVRRYYDGQLVRRGLSAILAMLLLAAALAEAVAVIADGDDSALAVDAAAVRIDHRLRITATARTGKLDDGEQMHLRVIAYAPKRRDLTLCDVVATPDRHGGATATCGAVDVARARAANVTVDAGVGPAGQPASRRQRVALTP